MIIFDIVCQAHHRFEGWFQHADDFDNQCERKLVSCPVCGSQDVRRVPSVNRISRHGNSASEQSHSLVTNKDAENYVKAQQWMRQLHHYVEKNTEDVGNQFADEARKIHYGESEERGIRGVASGNEVKELHDEGIKTYQLPPKPVAKEKLN